MDDGGFSSSNDACSSSDTGGCSSGGDACTSSGGDACASSGGTDISGGGHTLASSGGAYFTSDIRNDDDFETIDLSPGVGTHLSQGMADLAPVHDCWAPSMPSAYIETGNDDPPPPYSESLRYNHIRNAHAHPVTIITQPGPIKSTNQPNDVMPSAVGEIVFSCFVFWFCCPVFGFITLALSVMSAYSKTTKEARDLLKTAYHLNIAGIVFGIFLMFIFVVMAVRGAWEPYIEMP